MVMMMIDKRRDGLMRRRKKKGLREKGKEGRGMEIKANVILYNFSKIESKN